MSQNTIPAYIASLIRHFEDLRDGTHGGSASRKDKEAHFEKAVQLLAPIARQALNEMNINLLRDTGQLTKSGLRRTPDGGLSASWALSWPEQRVAGIEPIVLQAYFGGSFHHPHLRGTTVHDWPTTCPLRPESLWNFSFGSQRWADRPAVDATLNTPTLSGSSCQAGARQDIDHSGAPELDPYGG